MTEAEEKAIEKAYDDARQAYDDMLGRKVNALLDKVKAGEMSADDALDKIDAHPMDVARAMEFEHVFQDGAWDEIVDEFQRAEPKAETQETAQPA